MIKFDSGFLIVRPYAWLFKRFQRTRPLARRDQFIYAIPREGVVPESYEKQYAGIDRDPLIPWFEGEGKAPNQEPDAGYTLWQFEEQGRAQDSFIFSRDDAQDIYSRLKRKAEWELIWAVNAHTKVQEPDGTMLLGYEPTWFYGDHFSAVADCMCFPMWHGTDPEGTLFREHFDRLNKHALFTTPTDAQRFLDYYRSFDWTETGDYIIAKVMTVEPLLSAG